MRLLRSSLALFVSVAIAGCSTGSSVDVLQSVKTSNETTSSIMRSVVPKAAVGASAAGYPGTAAVTALAEPTENKAAAIEQVAMVRPQNVQPQAGPRRTVYSPNFRDAHPMKFGKVTPAHHAVHGVDVSRWQGNIDWPKLRSQGANFVFIKATDGGDHLDPMFHKNWKGAEAAGIRRGAYHFFYWCRVASEQADWFIRNVPKEAGALPPVIDVEWNGQSACKKRPSRIQVQQKMQVFMDKLEAHYGQRPIIYTAPDFYEDNLTGAFKDYPFWLRSVAAHPSVRYPGRDWVFWQYSGTGLSKGVGENIDLNVFHGNEAQWHKWIERNTLGSQMARN
ncbi:GH25 family lysozyme [Mesorhizobium sp. CAU 1732]|uniref:glycoside hydrolase family 25 protein n=1 Tax=Mesorhizobium sp. CAU 1732 TaxID=3140358 RepID=UPI003260CFD4